MQMQDVDVHPSMIDDRRLRPHSHHQQALKCPRCESLNTKFCYFNNYNLSQPRHFCKNCRRYWTKGGVLRNVPVGGGCRKPKLSKLKQPPNSHSTSDSSSAGTSTGVFQIPVSENFGVDVDLQPLIDSNHQIGDSQVMFQSEIGGLANLMNDNSGDPLATTTAAFSHGGMLDPIDDLMENRGSNGGDWPGGTAGSFDLLNLPSFGGVEYWSQTTSSHPHWSDSANSNLPLFLP